MALLWQRCGVDKTYEVRQAGASTRLYTNGIFHSQYNHRHPITGNLWNMLALPTYLHEHPGQVKRVLVLGVGGGAVIRHVLQAVPQAEVMGVDLDATHLMLARRFFHVKGKNVSLIHAEAVHWLTHFDGPGFDVIIDDLFGETVDARQLPQRAVPVTEAWLQTLQQHLCPKGVLAFNLESTAHYRELLRRLNKSKPHMFAQVSKITSTRYENVVAVVRSTHSSMSAIHKALSTEPMYRRWLLAQKLPYTFTLRSC